MKTEEKYTAENTWLNYSNQYLFESGTITEKGYKKMIEHIMNRMARLSGVWQKAYSCKYAKFYTIGVKIYMKRILGYLASYSAKQKTLNFQREFSVFCGLGRKI